MPSKQKIAVAGATGRLGRHVVDVLEEQGHEVVPISRSTGVDVITGEGLEAALAGVDTLVDLTTPPTPDDADVFFETSARNLQAAADKAGVERIVIVSIIGIDAFTTGYNAAKVAQERAIKAGPVPVRILRAAQFHEFVETMLSWVTQDDVAYVPAMRTQLVAARNVAEEVARYATADDAPALGEVAGPRPEELPDVARLVLQRNGNGVRVEIGEMFGDPEGLSAQGALLPGPGATLAGPTFEEWFAA